MTTAPKIEPCPNGIAREPNGHTAPIFTLGDGQWRVECACGWRGPLADTIPEAIEAWNRRAAPSAGLREAAQRFHDQVHDIAGEGFLNWRAKLQGHCAEFRAALTLSKEGGSA